MWDDRWKDGFEVEKIWACLNFDRLRITGCMYGKEWAYKLLRRKKMMEMEEEIKELIGVKW